MQFPRDDMFFIIGAPKCGTTSLSYHLASHPEICFSIPKEPHFFSADYPFGPPYISCFDDYLKCFPCSSMSKVMGEGSVLYLYSDEAVDRIEKFTGNQAKYIVCLRNPVDASFSLHGQHVAFNWEPEKNFLQALQRTDEDSMKSVPDSKIAKILQYKRLYSYSQYLEKLLTIVPNGRVMFWILEREMNNVSSYDRLHDFLGVSRRDVPIYRRVNEARRIKIEILYKFLTSSFMLESAKFLRRLFAPKGFGLGHPIRQISIQERQIAQSHFMDDIMLTSAIVDFDSKIWISP